MSLDTVSRRAAETGLAVLGTLALTPRDGLGPDARSLAMLGPAEPGFWGIFTAAPEYADGLPDPLDRWSRRVIGRIAADAGGQAVFPFGGPPWHPFISWALRTGRVFPSPVTLLVHDEAGLFVSFRGAVALAGPAPPVPARPSPCESCADRPCLSACPPGALTAGGYDVPACRTHLDSGPVDCHSGCLVRRACPVGQGRRSAAQSAFHMAAFHPGGGRR